MMLLTVPQVTNPSLDPVGLWFFCKVEVIINVKSKTVKELFVITQLLLTNVGLF